MVHIILFILKLIGIILASILGILVFLILVVLLVPIRYRINASNKETVHAEAKISWLFRLFYFRITFVEKRFVMKIFILGKVFYDSDKPKEKVKKEVKRFAKRVKTKVVDKVEDQVEDQVEDKVENRVEDRVEDKVEDRVEDRVEDQVIDKVDNQVVARIDHRVDERYIDHNESRLNEVEKQLMIDTPLLDQIAKKTNSNKDQEYKEEFIKQNEKEILEDSKSYHGQKRNRIFIKLKELFQKIKGLFLKVKGLFCKIKGLFIKIKGLLLGFKDTIINIKNKIIGIKDLWFKYKAFLQNDINKAGLKHIGRSLLKAFKHIRPTKLRIEMEFGTGDPCSTGQVLGVLAVLYGYYANTVQIIPNFEDAILEGTIFCKGRIRLFTLLIICIKLILDRHFRQLIKNFRAFKEEL